MSRFTGVFALLVVAYFFGGFTFPTAWRQWVLQRIGAWRERRSGAGLPPPSRPVDHNWPGHNERGRRASPGVIDYDPDGIEAAKRLLRNRGYTVYKPRKESRE